MLERLVTAIRIETAWLPPIVVLDPFSVPKTDEPGAASQLGALLKPRISVEVGGASRPLAVAPWGEPGPSKWPALRLGLIVAGAALGVFLIVRTLRK